MRVRVRVRARVSVGVRVRVRVWLVTRVPARMSGVFRRMLSS